MPTAASIVLVLSLLGPATVAAQYATPYGPVEGSRVRVTPRDSSLSTLTGRLRAFGGDSLLIDVGAAGTVLRMPVSALRRVEVNDGPDRSASAFLCGGIGLLSGGLLGGAALGHDPLERLVGTVVGMAMGLVGGAIGGAAFAPDRWRVVWTP